MNKSPAVLLGLLLAQAAAAQPPITASNPSAGDSTATSVDEDSRHNEARAYPMGAVQRVSVRKKGFVDADGRRCANAANDRLSPAKVRYFLANATPISQISLMNFYGEFGECSSLPVRVEFADGRALNLSFASESHVAYLSPLDNGQEVDVYFYYCEACEE